MLLIEYIKYHPIEVITFTLVVFSGFAVCYGIGYYAGLTSAIPLMQSGEKILVSTDCLDEAHQTLSTLVKGLKAARIVYDDAIDVTKTLDISIRMAQEAQGLIELSAQTI